MPDKKQVSIEELSSKFKGDNTLLSQVPTELSAGQKLTGFMSIILISLVVLLIVMSVNIWDGTEGGKFSDFWEYTKLIGTTIIGGVVATYLQPSHKQE